MQTDPPPPTIDILDYIKSLTNMKVQFSGTYGVGQG